MATLNLNLQLSEHERVVVIGMYASAVVTLVGVGLQMFMAVSCVTTFAQSSKAAKKGLLPYIVVGVLIWVLYAFTVALNVYSAYWILFGASTSAALDSITQGEGGAFVKNWWTLATSSTLVVLLLLGDGLLLFRCYILWKRSRWVWIVMLPGACYLATVGLGIRSAVLDDGFDRRFQSIGVLVFILNNIIITSLICFRLLRARRTIARLLPSQHMTVYSRVVVVLVEAAVPLTVFGIGYAVVLLVSAGDAAQLSDFKGKTIAGHFFATFYFLFVALSPLMIIYRVTNGRSWVQPADVSGETGSTSLVDGGMCMEFASSQAGAVAETETVEYGLPEPDEHPAHEYVVQFKLFEEVGVDESVGGGAGVKGASPFPFPTLVSHPYPIMHPATKLVLSVHSGAGQVVTIFGGPWLCVMVVTVGKGPEVFGGHTPSMEVVVQGMQEEPSVHPETMRGMRL
ncbi:hypothetical protein FA15DRAFT_709469 [Coprinopsis marcescibilis]|uniref:Uncharacterized protein n=1 Tax=Coprinopsis marcescibilis TaxID=230819 RepID=A0A5C3KFH5_COPMA|nr:hypothetical protein FA15DRAFT_709469 [Coprinopsis marcescibilis]